MKDRAVKLFSVILILCLSGCTVRQIPIDAKTKESTSAVQKTSVRFLVDDSRLFSAFSEAAEIFSLECPEVAVNVESVQKDVSFNALLRYRMQTEDMPDLFIFRDEDSFETFADQLWVFPNEELSNLSYATNLPSFFLEDKPVGLPIGLNAYGIIYNRAYLGSLGFQPDKLKTLSGLYDAAEEINGRIASGDTEGMPELKSFFAADKSSICDSAMIPRLFFSAEFSSEEAVVNAAKLDMQYDSGLFKLLDILKSFSNVETPAKALASGEAVAALGDMRLMADIVNEKGTLSGFGILPVAVRGEQYPKVFIEPAGYFAINRYSSSSKRKGAMLFIRWLYTSEEGLKILRQKTGFILPEEGKADTMGGDVGTAISEKKTADWLDPVLPEKFREDFKSAVDGYILGNIDAEVAKAKIKGSFTEVKR